MAETDTDASEKLQEPYQSVFDQLAREFSSPEGQAALDAQVTQATTMDWAIHERILSRSYFFAGQRFFF